MTLPTNATAIGLLEWTNTITFSWGIAIWALFLTFLLPMIYMIGLGKDKVEVTLVSAIISGVLMFFLSLVGLIPEVLVITMFVLAAIIFMMQYVKSKE